MRCAKCIHHNICYYEEEVIEPDKNNDCEDFEEVRPQGEWIDRMADKGYVECPFCHKQITGGDLNFCVKCGAKLGKGGAE